MPSETLEPPAEKEIESVDVPVSETETATNLLDLDEAQNPAPPPVPVPAPQSLPEGVEYIQPDEPKICNCVVSVKGRGKHSKTCPKYSPPVAKKENPDATEQTSTSTIADFVKAEGDGLGVNYEVMSSIVFDMSVATLSMALGPEWMPRKPANDKEPDERMLVVTSLAKYFETQQIKDIPPGYMLALVLSMYSLPRITQPSTKSKLVSAWLWCKEKFFSRRKKSVIASNS